MTRLRSISLTKSKQISSSQGASSSRFRIRLLISYDGTEFGGWQKQAEGKPTIQGELERVFSHILNEKIRLIGSGRTDAGVHALGQVAHFDCSKLPQQVQIIRGANSLLPPSIVIRRAWEAPLEFHARKSAIYKNYRYWILNRPFRSALRGRYLRWISRPLNLEYLQSCCPFITGFHDFSSFRTSGTETKTTKRNILKANWGLKNRELLYFSVTADGFLKQMVRNLVGTMLDLHFSGRPASDIQNILESCDRKQALGTARPEGLHLCRVFYPQVLDNKCRSL
ncbi:MAG: tRNA pseudouridine(38-40) synthase TruA [Bdellovibrionales bacterium]|nr:tRNA pseudouridine(38-40) synthase TruA [Bdellovibrionales bacterium]